jgi:hypothetical protein
MPIPTAKRGAPAAQQDPAERFHSAIRAIAEAHRPSKAPFFRRLAALPRDIASDPDFLGQLHLVYQTAMHATRAAVYHLPWLDSPALRRRKLEIFIDDDGLAGGDTHHYQLTRAFKAIGARCLLEDEQFGDIDELCRYLDADTAAFARLAAKLYARSLGAWCAVETLSEDWMRAFAEALSVHFPAITEEPYFADCFQQGVEERHAAEALAVTATIVAARPKLLAPTLRDAKLMAMALGRVWNRLDQLVVAACGTSRVRSREAWPVGREAHQ